MKKFFKCFLIVPIIFIAIFTFFACGEDKEISKINLSISTEQAGCSFNEENGLYILDKAKIEGETKRVVLSVSTDLSSFSVSGLSYSSDKESVAEVRKNNENFFLILGNNGDAKITLSYTRSDKKEVSASIRVLVSDTTNNIYFENHEYTFETTYTGLDLQNDYLVVQDPETVANAENGLFNYYYYDAINQTEVDKIIDAGRYKITCVSKQNSDDYVEAYLIVNKKKLSFTASDRTVVYGDELPRGLYYEGDVPVELTAFDKAETLNGIGREADREIGKIVETTMAMQGSDAEKRWPITVKMTLLPEYEHNYSLDYDVKEGNLTITPRKVIVVGKDQTAVYGDTILIDFDLYDYVENFDITKATPLDTSIVNYKKDISLDSERDVRYKDPDNNIITISPNRHLSVLIDYDETGKRIYNSYQSYQMIFDGITSSQNLIVATVDGLNPGSITIEPRPVTILPTKNLSKVYGSVDPNLTGMYEVKAGSFMNADSTIDRNFLSIVYNAYNIDGSVGEDGTDIRNPLGNGNIRAEVGKYYYEVITSKIVDGREVYINTNYDILLDDRATDSAEVDDAERVLFEVTPSKIVIEMENYGTASENVIYKAPSATGGMHTFGYYGSLSDYKLTIKTLTVNGVSFKEQIEENAGKIIFATGGTFSFRIGVIKTETQGDYYITYKTFLSEKTFDKEEDGTIVADESNFEIEFIESIINLSKIKVVVTLNSAYGFTKVYDAVDIATTTENLDSNLFGIRKENEDDESADGEDDETVINYIYPFINAVTVNKGTNEEAVINITDIIDFEKIDTIFTLVYNSAFFKAISGGKYEAVASFKNVGNYRINLIDEAKLSYISGKECYQLVLDETKTYNYSITKRTLLVVPRAVEKITDETSKETILTYQSKIYGDPDPEMISYDFENTVGELFETDDIILERTSTSENAGRYSVRLIESKKNFGENYVLELFDEVPFAFIIFPRKVTITPYSQSYIYGEAIQSLNFEWSREGELDATLLARGRIAEFDYAGRFGISLGGEGSIVYSANNSGAYPTVPVALDASGNVINYYIVQDSFNCPSGNYEIEFVETATFTVTKREAIVYIYETTVTSAQSDFILGEVSKDSVDIPSSSYEITNVVNRENVVFSFKAKLNSPDKNNNEYCDFDNDKWWLTIKEKGGEQTDLTDNYDLTLVSRVVYRFGITVVTIAIVTKDSTEGNYNSTFETTYAKKAFNDEFTIVCLTPNYEIVYGTGKTSYEFVYKKDGENDVPMNVGLYAVNLNTTSINFKIVLKNTLLGGDDIVFTAGNIGSVVNQTIKLSIYDAGYINIKKAKIVYNIDDVKLDGTYMYQPNYTSDKYNYCFSTMPLLIEGAFKGVKLDSEDGEEVKYADINLVQYKYGDNYLNYTANSIPFSNFKANYTYNITITIAVADEHGNPDPNYEALTLYGVQLSVSPYKMSVTNPVFSRSGYTGDSATVLNEIRYNGKAQSLSLDLSGDSMYTRSYNYQKLSIKPDAVGNSAIVYYRDYIDSEPNDDELKTMSAEELYDITISSFVIRSFNGTYYAIVNEEYCFVMQSNDVGVSPTNAGAYICIATCSARENYAFYNNLTEETTSYVQYACLFEIKKAGAVAGEIIFDEENDWETDFYYSTPFDFDSQNLPFNFSVYPSFLKNYAQFTMEDYSDLSSGGYLPFREEAYYVKLTFITENYYAQYELPFYIKKLSVSFVFPITTEYVYVGKNSPVKSFLQNIRVVLRDFSGNVDRSFYYDEGSALCKEITLGYTNLTTGATTYISSSALLPFEMGEYELIMIYGDESTTGVSNYYGRDTFKYEIVARAFTGSIRVENTTITYNPNTTHSEFYDDIVRRMFSIDIDEGEYELYVYLGSAGSGGILLDRDYETNYGLDYSDYKKEDLGWLAEVNYEGQHNITFVVNFTIDKTTKSITRSAVLNIKKVTLSQKEFNYDVTTASSYTYDGDRIYNYIAYGPNGEIPLDPADERGLEGEKSLYIGNNIYHFTTATESKNKIVILKDKMFNTIFELRYAYSVLVEGKWQNLDNAPIDPNTNYRVTYNITGGTNYSTGGIGAPYKDFAINKLTMIYISVGSITDDSLVYVGKSLIDNSKSGNDRLLGDINLAKSIIVKSYDGTGDSDLHYTLLDSSVYNSTYGIYLQVFFTDENGNLSTVENAGNYKMNISLAYTPTYDISKYFSQVTFVVQGARVAYRVEDFKTVTIEGVTRTWYDKYISVPFTVKKASGNITPDRWSEIIVLPDKTPEPTIEEVEGYGITVVKISASDYIQITANKTANLTIDEVLLNGAVLSTTTIGGGQSTFLEVGKYYKVTIEGNDNYEQGGPIYLYIERA